jgi:hypothetical protein
MTAYVHTKICAQVFAAPLLVVVWTWRQHRHCLSVWASIRVRGYYSAMKRIAMCANLDDSRWTSRCQRSYTLWPRLHTAAGKVELLGRRTDEWLSGVKVRAGSECQG